MRFESWIDFHPSVLVLIPTIVLAAGHDDEEAFSSTISVQWIFWSGFITIYP